MVRMETIHLLQKMLKLDLKTNIRPELNTWELNSNVNLALHFGLISHSGERYIKEVCSLCELLMGF